MLAWMISAIAALGAAIYFGSQYAIQQVRRAAARTGGGVRVGVRPRPRVARPPPKISVAG
jgi:hypothetical protein